MTRLVPHQRRKPTLALALAAAVVAAALPGVRATPAGAQDVSAAATLQLFESSWRNTEARSVDAFMAGYGGVWVPPPGRADSGNYSVGYDVYDRFDLGRPGSPTLYGTEAGLKAAINSFHRFGGVVYGDLVWNHNGFRDRSTPGFVEGGGYPGFTLGTGNNDGDFHSPFAGGDLDGRLSGLVDIDHATNLQYVRNPVVAGDPRNLPGQAATEANRRFYQSQAGPGRTLYDPKTGTSFVRHDFTGGEATTGTPVSENALGYLMRNAQWYVQDVGFDGFRLDATKHYEPFVLEYLDRAVYDAGRLNLDGSRKSVFSFGEALTGDMSLIQSRVRKDINPATPNVVGGNRDALDFPLHFALNANLTKNGFQNDWRNVADASFDRNDDGLANNGSQGVSFDASHDDNGAALGNVANAYLSMRPGNWIVYDNAKEFGQNRDFPKDGRGDALGGLYGDTITKLVDIRNTHGRGDYIERNLDKETLIYERDRSAVVALNNRVDGGFDERTVQTNFAPGTHLLELTGNAADASVDPFNDIPEVVTVDGNGRVTIRTPRNVSPDGNEHDKGYVIYGLSGPQGTLSLTGTSGTVAGGNPTAATNGTTRLADLAVVKGDSFGVNLQTNQVNLLGLSSLRDVDADGDNAVLRINDGYDANGNGGVDFTVPGGVVYGFERFADKSSPLFGGGDGQFVQGVDARGLPEGVNYVEVRAFRHRDDGGPAVYSSFKQAVYVDRLKPVSALAAVNPLAGAGGNFRQFQVRSVDQTADSVHTFLDLPANLTDVQVLAMVGGGNAAGQIDRDLFAYGYGDLASGNHVLTVVTYEITGNVNVQRLSGIGLTTGRGRGVGDVNFDGHFDRSDVFGGGAFEQVLYSGNAQFNAAADLNGDGRVDSRDLFALRPLYNAAGATAASAEARQAEIRRGNVDQSGGTDANDIDFLYAHRGDAAWLLDLDSGGGGADQADVDVLVRLSLATEYGDADLDQIVGRSDFDILRDHFGGRDFGWAGADFNGDRITDLLDLDILRMNLGFGIVGGASQDLIDDVNRFAASVPEPSSAALLTLAATALLRRRRAQN